MDFRNHGGSTLLTAQPFDTGIFGAPVARLDVPAAGAMPDLPAMAANWATSGIWLIFCRVAQRDDKQRVSDLLVRAGFQRVETLVTLERSLGGRGPSAQGAVDHATEADVMACAEIARTSFVTSRYQLDPRVEGVLASEYKAAWARNDIRGRADASFVVRRNGRAAGFNLCLLRDGAAVIDLIAVDREYQGQGIGKSLVMAALDHYAGRAPIMRVGTQAENARSMTLYRSIGFKEVARADTYHWINPVAALPSQKAKLK